MFFHGFYTINLTIPLINPFLHLVCMARILRPIWSLWQITHLMIWLWSKSTSWLLFMLSKLPKWTKVDNVPFNKIFVFEIFPSAIWWCMHNLKLPTFISNLHIANIVIVIISFQSQKGFFIKTNIMNIDSVHDMTWRRKFKKISKKPTQNKTKKCELFTILLEP